ncbi:P27 family phage terminase small subunit [Aeromonas jandaei]|nr:P27 family phage terminase small subunit [Aeromonas jandaei]
MPIIPLSDAEKVIYKKLHTVLKKERELKASDLEAVALLAKNIWLFDQASIAVEQHGFLITSETSKGVAIKQNPAAISLDNSQTKIVKLMEQLLMTPRSKVLADGRSELKEEDNDPITAALAVLKKKREKNAA